MSHPNDPRKTEPGRKPAHQTSESKGPIKKEQVTDAEMRTKDLPRGSEPETRAASSRR